MLIKCHLNYFCLGYKKKLETFSSGYLLLIAIHESSAFWACNVDYFPFENMKKTSKISIGTPNGKRFVFPLTIYNWCESLCETQAFGTTLEQYKIKAKHPWTFFLKKFQVPHACILLISLYFRLDLCFPGSKKAKVSQNNYNTSA